LSEELTPVRTGSMRQSWYVTEQGDLNSASSNRAPCSLYFIEGTSPHEIRPRFASVLRFQSGTDVVFTKLLNHPSTKPSDLLEQVKKGAEQEIPRFFGEAWDEVTDYKGLLRMTNSVYTAYGIIDVMGDVVDAILADRTLIGVVKDIYPTNFGPGSISYRGKHSTVDK
jgi:hypothetical protein